MLQFSLRSLLVAVTVFAVGTAALLSANHWWSALLWGVALVMLAFAGLMVLFRRDAQRAYWGGFLLVGSLYVLLLMRSVPDANGFGRYMPLNYDNLITTKVTVRAYFLFPSSRTSQWLPPAVGGTSGPGGGGVMMGGMMGMSGGMGGPGAGMAGFGTPMSPNPAYLDIESFTAIGHALWTLLLAWLGGLAALWAFSNRDKRNATGTEAARTTP